MTNTDLLEKKISSSGLKKYHIAKQLGLTSFGFIKKVKNKNEFKASEIDKLCEILKIETLEERQAIFFAR